MCHKPINSLFGGRVTYNISGSVLLHRQYYVICASSLDEARDILIDKFRGFVHEVIDIDVWSEDFPIVGVKDYGSC